MAKFKVGDKIVCVNPGHNVELKLGDEYTVKYCGEQEQGSSYPAQVGIDLAQPEWSVDRFELVKEPAPNGVDAEGKAIFFNLTNLKSWMRVTTTNDYRYIVAELAGVTVLVREGAWCGEPRMTGSFALEAVYEAPDPEDYLNLRAQGDLVWKRQASKTAEQEAALAARNKAIEEAEKALNVAQQKLNELKGL